MKNKKAIKNVSIRIDIFIYIYIYVGLYNVRLTVNFFTKYYNATGQ